MSQNKLPSIERLIQRISAAERAQQKEIRISIQEARELAQDLALVTSNIGKTIQDIQVSLKEIKDSNKKIDIKFDGGSF